MESRIHVEVVKEKSFDPNFLVRVSYDDGSVSFKNELVSVSRKPPRVTVEYPENIEPLIEKADKQKIEIEIMKAIVETLLNSSGKRL